ncbi:MAG: ABC transporter substrate-binding protein [Pseudomonadota bacterium]|nr:ABC transporter substrate-binding protein [Pseudomonadota bacterium]
MLRRRFCLVSFVGGPCLLALGCRDAIASAETEQAKFITSLINKAVTILELPIENRADREAGFRNLVRHDFDMPTIVRLVLGRHWRTATTGQRKRFANAFLTHLISVYSDRLNMYDGQILEIEKSAPLTDKDTVVFTHISREGALPLRLDWRVRQTGTGLKVIDIATEGVSMVTTKRSEFTSLVAREGVEALIARLENMHTKSSEDSS